MSNVVFIRISIQKSVCEPRFGRGGFRASCAVGASHYVSRTGRLVPRILWAVSLDDLHVRGRLDQSLELDLGLAGSQESLELAVTVAESMPGP